MQVNGTWLWRVMLVGWVFPLHDLLQISTASFALQVALQAPEWTWYFIIPHLVDAFLFKTPYYRFSPTGGHNVDSSKYFDHSLFILWNVMYLLFLEGVLVLYAACGAGLGQPVLHVWTLGQTRVWFTGVWGFLKGILRERDNANMSTYSGLIVLNTVNSLLNYTIKRSYNHESNHQSSFSYSAIFLWITAGKEEAMHEIVVFRPRNQCCWIILHMEWQEKKPMI